MIYACFTAIVGLPGRNTADRMSREKSKLIPIFLLVLAWMIPASAADRPNILFVLADDLGYTDISPYGSEIDTPNLDKLARNGLRLSNAHATPACSSTRAVLLTGSDAHLVGLGKMQELPTPDYQRDMPGYEGYLTPGHATIADALRHHGYATMIAGKWHLGREIDQSPAARGFDRSFVLTTGYASHFGAATITPVPILDNSPPGPEYREDGEAVYGLPEDFYSSDYFAERLIGYLEENRDSGKPFFAYLAFTAPHWPLQAPRAYINKYEGRYDAGYDVLWKQRFEGLKDLGLVAEETELPPHEPIKPRWDSLDDGEQARQARLMEVYAGMVDNMDANIGRVVDYLKRTGQYDNTVIVFMSDNGADPVPEQGSWLSGLADQSDNSLANLGDKGSFAMYGPGWARAGTAHWRELKGAAFEGGLRVPVIIRMPQNTRAGELDDRFFALADWFPTLLELAGSKTTRATYGESRTAPARGRSRLALLSGSGHDNPDRVVGWEMDDDRGLRKGRWKLVHVSCHFSERTGLAAGWKLYDLEKDPAELVNLADERPDVMNDMLAEWERYVTNNNVILPPVETEN